MKEKRDLSFEPGDPELGAQLASLRLRAALTQADVSHRIGVSRQHISNIENGQTSPTIRVLKDYLQICGKTIPEFFYGPLPTTQTPKQRDYHRKLQILLEDSSLGQVVQKVIDSFISNLELSAREKVQPARVRARAGRQALTPRGPRSDSQ